MDGSERVAIYNALKKVKCAVNSSNLEDIISAITNRLFEYTQLTNMIAGPTASTGKALGTQAELSTDKTQIKMGTSYDGGNYGGIRFGIRTPIDVTNLNFILADISASGAGGSTSLIISNVYPETSAQVASASGRSFASIGNTYCVGVTDLVGKYYLHAIINGYHGTAYTWGYGLISNIRYV